ncbi:acetyl-CoA carboxylase biotin carboxyl carrier protein [Capsulimonas corticalis]|nr:biotin/lipoyl-containing protein [Capsulimonas corticalis]
MTLESIEEIVALLEEHPVAEIEIEEEGRRILVRKASVTRPAPVPAIVEETQTTPQAEAAEASETAPAEPAPSILLTAPMVGIFHHHDPPIRYGAIIQTGQLVGYIESLKLMNEVTADIGGRVTEVLEDNTAVGYGQPLFRIEPV